MEYNIYVKVLLKGGKSRYHTNLEIIKGNNFLIFTYILSKEIKKILGVLKLKKIRSINLLS